MRKTKQKSIFWKNYYCDKVFNNYLISRYLKNIDYFMENLF